MAATVVVDEFGPGVWAVAGREHLQEGADGVTGGGVCERLGGELGHLSWRHSVCHCGSRHCLRWLVVHIYTSATIINIIYS